MRRRLLDWLACPLCREGLALVPFGAEGEDGAEIDLGALVCRGCGVYYPITGGVPRLLTYPAAVSRDFAAQHAGWIADRLAGCQLPSATPPPGEEATLRSFSTEWTNYKWTGKSYWATTPQVALEAKRYELGLDRHPITGKLALEVGIGIGGTADALSRSEGCEIVGMDLGYAVDQAQRYFGSNPHLHIIQASVFAPPFKPGTFDVVYSHGVIHYTYDTRAALARVAPLPKPGGMLYIWVYSHAQEQATPLRRALMAVERVARPILSRLPSPLQTVALLPAIPAYLAYQNLYARRWLGPGAARFGWNEAMHAARNRLTPPLIARHTYEEVAGWFRDEGYSGLEMLRDEPPPEGVSSQYPLNVGIRGFRVASAQGQSATHA